jgi:ketosteroid isomerase-like protein
MAIASPPAGHPNAVLIARFYAALDRRDAEAMIACYAKDAEFSDPVFPRLDAEGVAAMWRMLCARGKDLHVVASGIEADATAGHAHWVATYTYSATGNKVINRIDAEFTFRDGRIVHHVDRFDLYRWIRQALGTRGMLLGWLPPVQRAVRAQAAKALAASRAKDAPVTGAAPPGHA